MRLIDCDDRVVRWNRLLCRLVSRTRGLHRDNRNYESDGHTGSLGRVENVQLVPSIDDNDPQNVLYHTRVETPVIFVDIPVIAEDFPNLTLVHTEAGGFTAIVAATD